MKVYTVGDMMSKPLITVDGEASAKDSIKLMVERDIGALVITEKGKPVGIVTERDVLKKCCIESSLWEFKISEIMSSPLVTVEAEQSILTAEEIMAEKNIRRLLVTEGEKIVGIITQRDLVRGNLKQLRTLNLGLSMLLH